MVDLCDLSALQHDVFFSVFSLNFTLLIFVLELPAHDNNARAFDSADAASQAEVAYLDAAVFVYKHIGRLKVSVNNVG